MLTSTSDAIPGFQNPLPGLKCVLQPSCIVQRNFKTLTYAHNFNHSTLTDTLPVLQEISSLQNVILKPQKQITKVFYNCFVMVGCFLLFAIGSTSEDLIMQSSQSQLNIIQVLSMF